MRAFVLSLSLLLAPAIAHADAYDAAIARALVAKEKALDSNDPTDWEAALRLFEEADAIKPTSVSKYELAHAAARLKADDVAYEAYEAALDLGLEGPAKAKSKAFLDANRAAMAKLDVRAPQGTAIYVGSRRRGTAPLARPIVVFAGPVHLRLTAPSGTVVEEDLNAKAETTTKVDLVARFSPPPPAPSIEPQEAKKPHDVPPRSALPTVLLVSGGALVVVSGVALAASSIGLASRRDALAESCAVRIGRDECEATWADRHAAAQGDVDAIASWKSARLASAIGLGVGALTAGAGLVLAWTGKDERAAAVRPTFALTGASLALGVVGSF